MSDTAKSKRTWRRGNAGVAAGLLVGGACLAAMTAPAAMAVPDQCSAQGLAGTISSTTGAARQYLATHPGADNALTAAYGKPRDQAVADLRGYFTANPGEYFELRDILAPIGTAQQQCNVTVLPPDLASAYSQFMAG